MGRNLITWVSKPFDALSAREMHRILMLRQDVFVIEQDCIYPDIDTKDDDSVHVFGIDQEQRVVAYARLVPPGLKYDEPAVGRVVVEEQGRGIGLGYRLMEYVLAEADKMYPKLGNRISAQAHLKAFYESFGYAQVSDVYDEDGIPHIEMLRPPAN